MMMKIITDKDKKTRHNMQQYIVCCFDEDIHVVKWYCPGGYCLGGFCPGGFCPGGYCLGGYCPGDIVQGILSRGILS